MQDTFICIVSPNQCDCFKYAEAVELFDVAFWNMSNVVCRVVGWALTTMGLKERCNERDNIAKMRGLLITRTHLGSS